MKPKSKKTLKNLNDDFFELAKIEFQKYDIRAEKLANRLNISYDFKDSKEPPSTAKENEIGDLFYNALFARLFVQVGIKSKIPRIVLKYFLTYVALLNLVSKKLELQFDDDILIKKIKSDMAKYSVSIKLKNDPKQIALKEIENEFNNSLYPFHKRGYRAKFCKEMQEKHIEIKDIKTIERLFDRMRKHRNTPSAS